MEELQVGRPIVGKGVIQRKTSWNYLIAKTRNVQIKMREINN